MTPTNDKCVPRNGLMWEAGIVARISGGPHQKDVSLEDQVDHGKEEIAPLCPGPIKYMTIKTTAKGERLDRPELEEIERVLRTRELDILFIEDLGRLVRGTEAVRLLGIARDHGTRAISPNDCVDTDEDTWEEDAIAACRDHVSYNSQTSKRLKQKLMNRFRKSGAAPARPIYGCIVPDGAKTYYDWKRNEAATPIIREGARILRETLNCSTVADYFNKMEVPITKRKRARSSWNGKKIRQFYGNMLLKGQPGRGFRHTVKHYETGRRVAVTNPKGPTFIDCPQLAHLDADEFDSLDALLDAHFKNRGRKPVNGNDPRRWVPRNRTRFPGQHARCWYCGCQHVWGGNGITVNLMCNGAREWRCWNSIGYDGTLLSAKLVGAITAELYALNGFDQQFRRMVAGAQTGTGDEVVRQRYQLQSDEADLAQRKLKVKQAIEAYGADPVVKEMLQEITKSEIDLGRRTRELERIERSKPQLPGSVAELRQLLQEQLATLAAGSPEFGDLMRKLAPEVYVYLVRLCDGGHLLPRAKIKLTLDGIVPDAKLVAGLPEMLSREVTIDLFEPPQREQIRERAVAMAAQGVYQRQIAAELNVTQTAVGNALALASKMAEMGLPSPYVIVDTPPDDYIKLRRHRNSRYRFEAVDGYQPPPL